MDKRCLKQSFKAEGVYRAVGNKNNKAHYKTNNILKTNTLSLNCYEIMNRCTLPN